MPFTVAIIGRPNVGKSTMFNRLTGKQHAIVDDTPGVTRDRREGAGSISDLEFSLIDTAGLENAYDDSLESHMRQQTEMAIKDADITLFLVDGRAGVTPLDDFFANWLRKQKTPTLLVVNKCEGKAGKNGLYEAYGLGLGEPIPFSAEHGEGLSELYEALEPYSNVDPQTLEGIDIYTETEDEGLEDQEDEVRPLKLAIIGRPNVGKSTMINKMLGQERLLTGPEAGVTRDAIAIAWEYEGREVRLVDTAGLRRKARIKEKLENMSVGDTLRSIRFAEVVILVLDANAPLDKQDLTIARHVVEEGRALIIVVNKWDIAESRAATAKRMEDRLQTSLPQVRGVPIVMVSSKTGKGLRKIMPAVLQAYKYWNTRVSTGALNRWLLHTVDSHPPPVSGLGRIKLRYITQARTRPPTFILFSSRADKLPESYMRYLINQLRVDFDMPGIPIRIHARKGENPYANK
jgi:GTP-binding protein